MKYLSLCSGIEAATVAWHPLGWKAVAYSEIEKFPSQVLAHHYPSTPNLGDMTKFKEWNLESNVDLLVGGTPCQSFSVAGLRKGLDDPRGNLMLTYLAIAKQYCPNWLVWENVPGVLSSNGGRDFGSFLGGLAECGYGFAYRVLDAQYFGVAQRRRRVFVVGYLGDWRPAAAVLFERHSLSGHPAPSREKREGVAASTDSSIDSEGLHRIVGALCADSHPGAYSGQDAYTGRLIPQVVGAIDCRIGAQRAQNAQSGHMLPVALDENTTGMQPAYGIPGNWIGRKPENGGNATEPMYDIAPCLTKADQHGVAQPMAYNISPGKGALKEDIHVTDADATKTLDASASNPAMHQGGTAIVQAITFSGQMSNPHTNVGITQTLQAKNPMAVMQPIGVDTYNGAETGQVSCTITADVGGPTHSGPKVLQAMAVRRLTPKECERLQGFGDNYTDIQPKGKPTPDGPRYKALGNSMAVPVMAWIGQRIQEVEAICKQNK
jgi:DNA (cytosine-5)-methyltransferase 1